MKKGYVSDRNFMILIASIAIVVIFALLIFFTYDDRNDSKSECSSVDDCSLDCGNLTPACIFDASNIGNCLCMDISI